MPGCWDGRETWAAYLTSRPLQPMSLVSAKSPHVSWRRGGGRRASAQRHRAGMAGARPGGEQQQQPCVRACHDLVALRRRELDQQSAAVRHAFAGGAGDLDAAGENHHPRALVHLVLGEPLARPQVEGDRARLRRRGQDLGQTRLEVEARDVPASRSSPSRRGLGRSVAVTLTHSDARCQSGRQPSRRSSRARRGLGSRRNPRLHPLDRHRKWASAPGRAAPPR